ncbi:MAG: Asp-tRNA(Asn)/Glu-tRNA(Gln) amidotransferase subunit GatC [Candidatus Sungbacteria bacterium]|nr:Asp-tRNA(Asn)/Glu-tRNA(Gln) amidotransferase subunit GatC [Candidatus Sungbacteria bacterium]
MSINAKDVKHIAKLARIELTEGEVEKFEKDLDGILDFVNQLSEVDTSGILPLAGGLKEGLLITLEDGSREDEEIAPFGSPAELVDAAPKKDKGWIEVPSVF